MGIILVVPLTFVMKIVCTLRNCTLRWSRYQVCYRCMEFWSLWQKHFVCSAVFLSPHLIVDTCSLSPPLLTCMCHVCHRPLILSLSNIIFLYSVRVNIVHHGFLPLPLTERRQAENKQKISKAIFQSELSGMNIMPPNSL